MSTNFPGAIDDSSSLPNPTAGSATNSPSHAGLHDNANDAIKAMESKLGTGAATPVANRLLTGTGTGTSDWSKVAPAGTVVGTSDSQTLTNKTLTSPTINTPVINSLTADNPTLTGGGLWSGSPTITTPTIASFANANHDHSNAAGGGSISLSLFQNAIINGGCTVNQLGSTPSLTSSYVYAPIDMFAAKGSGTVVSAGTITQTSSANVGTSGYALRLAGTTITGSGVVYVRHRIESLEAVQLKNQTASFSCKVYHDVGSTITYTVVIRKPTVADNYGATTTIATSAGQSVLSATVATLLFENIGLGDVTNGIEIEIQAACGAITTKNFEFTEFVLNRGATATYFMPELRSQTLTRCMRYYQNLVLPRITGVLTSVSAPARMAMNLTVPMRIAPTCTIGALPIWDGTTLTTIASISNSYHTTTVIEFDCTSAAPFGGINRPVIVYQTGSAAVIADARL